MALKLKTRRSAAKRVNKKKDFFSRKKAFQSHFLRRKTAKRLRSLATPSRVSKSDTFIFKRMLP